MVRPNVVATDHERPAGVAEAFQRTENPVCASSSQVRAVLKSDPTSAASSAFAAEALDLPDDADGLEIEPASLPVDALPLGVGAADILAGRGASDEIGKSSNVGKQSFAGERADIVIDQDSGIVFGIEGPAPRDPFAGGEGLKSGPVKAKRPATGRRAEKVENLHAARSRSACPAPSFADATEMVTEFRSAQPASFRVRAATTAGRLASMVRVS